MSRPAAAANPARGIPPRERRAESPARRATRAGAEGSGPAPARDFSPVTFRFDGAAAFKGRGRIARPRDGSKRFIVSPKATVRAERSIREEMGLTFRGDPLEGPLDLRILVFCAVPASWSRKRRAEALAGLIRPTVKPDFDNIVKIYSDAANRFIWRDDAQIVGHEFTKWYGEAPAVLMCVARPGLLPTGMQYAPTARVSVP